MPKTFVMSTPRSGLNWLRTCIETFSGRATPGLQLIHKKPLIDLFPPFIRSHDPSGFEGRPDGRAYRRIGARDTRRAKFAFLIRDPRELYGREVQRIDAAAPPDLFFANVAFYVAMPTRDKAHFYYEEFVKEPAAMAEILTFLGVATPEGARVTTSMLEDRWDEMGALGRSLYDKNQAKAGGATTKADPYNFAQHQTHLTEDHLRRLYQTADRMLDDQGRATIGRYGFDKTAMAR